MALRMNIPASIKRIETSSGSHEQTRGGQVWISPPLLRGLKRRWRWFERWGQFLVWISPPLLRGLKPAVVTVTTGLQTICMNIPASIKRIETVAIRYNEANPFVWISPPLLRGLKLRWAQQIESAALFRMNIPASIKRIETSRFGHMLPSGSTVWISPPLLRGLKLTAAKNS